MLEDRARQPETTPETYEERLVPHLFGPWARRIAAGLPLRDGQRILDVACGTGVLARAIAARSGAGPSITGLDINPDMLAVAARLAPRIEWCHGDVAALPFDDRSFDAVACQFGLMLFDDPVAALEEMWRVLSPGGSLVVAVFDRLERNAAYAEMIPVYRERAGASVGDTLRMPFSLGDTKHLSALIADASSAPVTVRTEAVSISFADVRQMVMADVKGWFPFAGIDLDDDLIEAVVADAGKALARFITAKGCVEFELRAHIATAVKR